MSWTNAYVGTPFSERGRTLDGVDCWGLVRLVYRAELGIELPDYGGCYTCTAERAELAQIVRRVEVTGPWRSVRAIAPFDVLLFRVGRHRSHVGLAVDCRRMLHVDATDHAKIVDRTMPRWRSRFEGAFRHEARP